MWQRQGALISGGLYPRLGLACHANGACGAARDWLLPYRSTGYLKERYTPITEGWLLVYRECVPSRPLVLRSVLYCDAHSFIGAIYYMSEQRFRVLSH